MKNEISAMVDGEYKRNRNNICEKKTMNERRVGGRFEIDAFRGKNKENQ